jgi:hypothetical protein
MRSVYFNHKGLKIESFDLRQLGDPEVKGKTYSVYHNGEHVSAMVSLRYLYEARDWANEYLNNLNSKSL